MVSLCIGTCAITLESSQAGHSTCGSRWSCLPYFNLPPFCHTAHISCNLHIVWLWSGRYEQYMSCTEQYSIDWNCPIMFSIVLIQTQNTVDADIIHRSPVQHLWKVGHHWCCCNGGFTTIVVWLNLRPSGQQNDTNLSKGGSSPQYTKLFTYCGMNGNYLFQLHPLWVWLRKLGAPHIVWVYSLAFDYWLSCVNKDFHA